MSEIYRFVGLSPMLFWVVVGGSLILHAWIQWPAMRRRARWSASDNAVWLDENWREVPR